MTTNISFYFFFSLSLLCILFIYLFIFFAVLGLQLRAYTLSHSASSLREDIFFEIGTRGTISPGYLSTAIILISAL
jgi:hypothetical protein